MMYYTSTYLTDFDRNKYDLKRDLHRGSYNTAYVPPIASSKKDRENLEKIVAVIDEVRALMKEAPAPTKNPACIRKCCYRKKKRCSCCCNQIILFGVIKQLGLVLKNMFKSEHHWVPTTDGNKLDCMFFRARVGTMNLMSVDIFNRSNPNVILSNVERELENKDLERPTFIICNSNAMFYQ